MDSLERSREAHALSGRILLYETDVAIRISLRSRLAGAGYVVETIDDMRMLPAQCRRARADIVLCDLNDAGDETFRALRALEQGTGSSGPDIVGLSSSACPEMRCAALEAGTVCIVDKPLDIPFLMARLRRLMRNRRMLRPIIEDSLSELSEFCEPGAIADFDPLRVVVVAAAKAMASPLQRRIRGHLGNAVVTSCDPAAVPKALAHAGSAPAGGIDVYLIDARADGLREALCLVSEIRSRKSESECRVCLLLPEARVAAAQDTELLCMASDLGADDIFRAALSPREIAARVLRQAERRRRAVRLERHLEAGLRLAMRDPLTGAYNRRFAQSKITKMLGHSARAGTVFSILAVDLDRFKTVNDTFGHVAGDAVLQEVCRRIDAELRPQDLLVRSGGEEFWILLPDTEAAEAEGIACRIGSAVRGDPIVLPDRKGLSRVTISIGIAEGNARNGDTLAHAVISRADAALYHAKTSGRDRVIPAGAAA